jgi:hypothetical protein
VAWCKTPNLGIPYILAIACPIYFPIFCHLHLMRWQTFLVSFCDFNLYGPF